MVAQEPSMLGSEMSFTATDLSKKTDRSGFSIPDDGRPLTIQTDRAARRKKRREDRDSQSLLSQGTSTSLLIEYFENGKAGPSGRQPSVRVKVTPSASKRHNVNPSADGTGLEISEVNGSGTSRRPTHTHRIQLAPRSGVDRSTLSRARSYSGDHSSLSSFVSGDDGLVSNRGPLNVTVIREADSQNSMLSSPREMDNGDYAARRRRRRTASRSGTGDSYYEDSFKAAKQRSRSVSRESDIQKEAGLRPQLNRRRSRSLSRERLSQRERERIEQAVRDELEKVQNPKTRKTSKSRVRYDDTLKPPRTRSRSRNYDTPLDELAAEKVRARRKAALIEGESTVSQRSTTNPALVELIRGTIRELLLPEIEHMKADRDGTPSASNLLSDGTERSNLKVVLSPDFDRTPGLGVMLSGGDKEEAHYMDQDNNSRQRRSLRPGMPDSPMNSEGSGVPLAGTSEGGLLMPDGPFRSDTPGTYAETRASIQSARSPAGVPYPMHGKDTAMPSSGNSPPPGAAPSEFPELSELQFGNSEVGALSSVVSDPSAAGQSTFNQGVGAPSIASLNYADRELGRESPSLAPNGNNTNVQHGSGYSNLSLDEISAAPTSVIAKDRKGRRRQSKKGVDELSDIHERDDASTSSRKLVASFFADQREREQERALLNGGGFQDTSIEVRHVSTVTDNSFDARRLDKVDTGHQVFDLGANPSMRSTPVLAHSAVASVLNPSNVGSALTNLPPSPQQQQSPQPQLGANAMPRPHDPLPDFSHQFVDDEDEINTNPSIIQGPIGHHQGTNWDIADEFGVGGERGLNVDHNPDMQHASTISPRPNSRLMSPPSGKDEGYITAADPIGSPGTATPDQGMRGDPGVGSIDDMLSDPDFYQGHQRNRVGSGNSHGMPSPLYDSATGRGMDRIESKDIVALMEHLTVRDAQRNARDTEILVTLVRSAAEMRNSFEDMKKALADQRRDIVSDVDHNTERSVQKLLQGPRPLPPSNPRKPRYSKSDEDAEDEARENRAKRASVFKRALKGLSMGSSKDLERIEEMLCKLLGDVEGLKEGQQFYQQSMLHSQSMGTIDQVRGVQDPSEIAQSSAFVANNSAGNSGYYSAGPSRQPSGKVYDGHQGTGISPIQEDAVLDSPPREIRPEPLSLNTPPDQKFSNTSLGNTPTKSTEKGAKRESGSSSLFPRISRWSETTASTGGGFKNIFSKSKNNNDSLSSPRSPPDFNYWETEEAKRVEGDPHQSPFGSEAHREERTGSPLVPPSSRDTDAPINQSNRISLDIQHPRPRVTYNHQLEQQAQQLAAEGGAFLPQSPNNASVSSLGNYPPLGPGGFQNGKLLSPLAQDAYAQHQAQMSASGPPKPPKVPEDVSQDGGSVRKHKKHRERDENGEKIRKPKKERTEEEKQRRREKKEERKRSKDLLTDEGPSISGRTPSTASRLNGPRPLSSLSNKENSRRRNDESFAAENEYVSYR